MPILAKEGSQKEYFKVPAGTSQGACYDVWDLGWQRSVYQGEEKVQHKIVIAFEIDEAIPSGEYAGKRMTINAWYTLSLHKKSTLRAVLESWRGRPFTEEELKGFDLEKLIGVNAMLGIIHKGEGDAAKVRISSISKLIKNAQPMVPENKRSFPDWVKEFQFKSVDDPSNTETLGDAISPDEEPLAF